MLCNSCNSENGRQLAALAQQQRNNEGRHLAKQAGQLLPQGVWGKADEAVRQAALERLERRSRNAQGLTRAAAVRSYHSVG